MFTLVGHGGDGFTAKRHNVHPSRGMAVMDLQYWRLMLWSLTCLHSSYPCLINIHDIHEVSLDEP